MLQTTIDIAPPIPRQTPLARALRHVRRNALAYVLILPSLVFLAAIEFYPLGVGLLEGFKYHNRVQPWLTAYNGLDNYRQALEDPAVREALRVSVVSVGAIVAVSYVLGLAAALLLHQRLRGRGVYRALILVPWIVPPVVAYISWQFMLADETGFINGMLRRLGLIDEPILWLANPNLALISMIVVGVWSRVGFMMITMLAALAAIPDELHEAAAIDGASRWQTFRRVTFPLILPVSIIATLLQAIWTFNDFALPFVLTGGGPANATTTTVYYIYQQAFQFLRLGYGSALSVVLFAIILVFSLIQLRVFRDESEHS